MTKRFRNRSHEYVCFCDAYSFPHRMFGGDCTGQAFAEEYWLNNYGAGECETCNSYDADNQTCDVYDGVEEPLECNAVQDLIREYDIKIY